MALVSIAMVLLLICGLVVLSKSSNDTNSRLLRRTFTPVAVLVCLTAFALSLTWTVAPTAEALDSLGKYGKLIVIVLMLMLIRDRREAKYALGIFAVAQVFLMLSSWMLFMNLPVPWATSRQALYEYAVFSSYIDQGIIGAVFAAICWHFRHMVPGKFGKHAALLVALATLCNVLFVLSGRTGHVVAVALLSVAIMWELPKKYRLVVVFLPFIVGSIFFLGVPKVRERIYEAQAEIQGYSPSTPPSTSSAQRLNFWRRALQSIGQNPLAGTGVGSWDTQFNQLERAAHPSHKDASGNPHQEYLLWGVQLGIPGILMFLGLMLAMLKDTLKMQAPYARATQSTLLAMAVACLFNASIYDAKIGAVFCVLLGLLLALGLRQAENPSPLSSSTGSSTGAAA